MVRPRPVILALATAALIVPGCGDDASGSGGPLRVERLFGETGRFPGQFSYPRGIDAHGGSIIVVDRLARVQRIDPATGRFLGGFQMAEWSMGKPTGLTVGPHPLAPGRRALYVADTHYHRVLVFDLPDEPEAVTGETVRDAPEPIATFGRYGTGDGEFIYPTDVAVLASGDPDAPVRRLYVGEYGGNDRVSLWEPTRDPANPFAFAGSFGSHGTGDGAMFSRPQSLAIDTSRNELIIADAANHRVGRFTLEGEPLGWIGSPAAPGDGPTSFRYPYGLALLDDGTVLVAEFGGHRVSRVNLVAGEILERYGVAGRRPGELASPWGITVIGRDAYVLDSGNNRVQAFRAPAAAARAAGAMAGRDP